MFCAVSKKRVSWHSSVKLSEVVDVRCNSKYTRNIVFVLYVQILTYTNNRENFIIPGKMRLQGRLQHILNLCRLLLSLGINIVLHVGHRMRALLVFRKHKFQLSAFLNYWSCYPSSFSQRSLGRVSFVTNRCRH